MNPKTLSWILLGVGATLGICMSVLMGCFPTIYSSVVDKNVVIKEDSVIWDSYVSPPIPIYMQFYFFNVVNPKEVLYYGEKPVVEEVGPYVYEETREKFNMTFTDEGKYVTYKNMFRYYFREELSGGLKESDTITTMNMVILVLANLLHEHENVRWIWPEIERTMDVFEPHNVSELLFEGWELPTFNFNFADVPIVSDRVHYNGTIAEILEQMNVTDIPEVLVENKIGYFSLLNNTFDGIYKVNTGSENIDDYLSVETWNNEPELSWWKDTYCNMINGTDGTQFPPRSINEDVTVYIFVTQLCRSLYLNFDEEIDFYGIKALRFRPPPALFESPTTNADNACFCNKNGTLGCLPDGFMEMSPCANGVPLVMSSPHYFNGDPKEVDKFVGLTPDIKLHDTVLDIETTFGVPVSAHKRIQLNLPLRRYGNLTSFINVDSLLFPVLWADEMAELSSSDASDMKKALDLPFTLMYSIGGVLLLVSLALLVLGLKKRRDARAYV